MRLPGLSFATLLLLVADANGARIASGKRRRNGGRSSIGRRPGSESHHQRRGPPVYANKRVDDNDNAASSRKPTDENKRNLQYSPEATCNLQKCSDHCTDRCESKIGSYLDSKWYYCDAHTHDGTDIIQPPLKKGGGKAGKGGSCGSTGHCQGDCQSDDDCTPGLSCLERSDLGGNSAAVVPGCSVGPEGLYPKVDFCHDEAADTCVGDLGYWLDTDCIAFATCLRDKFFADNVESISSSIADKAYYACTSGMIDPLGPEPIQYANGECDTLLTQSPTISPQPTSFPTTPYPTYTYGAGKGYIYPTPEPTDATGPTRTPTENPTPMPSKVPTTSPTRKPTPSSAMCSSYWTCVKEWELDPTNADSTTNILAEYLEANATIDCVNFDDPNDKNDPLWGGYEYGYCDEHLGGYFKTCDDYWYCHEQRIGGDLFCSHCAKWGMMDPACGEVSFCQAQCNSDMLFAYECNLLYGNPPPPPTDSPTQRPTPNYLFDDYDFNYNY